MPHENVEIVLRVYDALNRGTIAEPEAADLVREIFDPGVVLEQWEALPGSTVAYHGYEGLRRSWRELNGSFEGLRFVTERHVEAGDSVVVGVHASGWGRGSGVPVDAHLGHLWVLRNARIVRWTVYATFGEALEASGARE